MVLYILDVDWFEKNKCCEALTKNKKHHQAGQYLLEYVLGKEAYEQALFAVGEHGKPYIVGHPTHYNISHSGSYVVLITAVSEVGVDVQEKKAARLDTLAKRFFRKEEWQAVKACATEQEKRNCFYHLWCRKEAYGKYLGVGLNETVLQTNVLQNAEDYYFSEYDKLEGYQISICCGKEEEVEEVISVFEGL